MRVLSRLTVLVLTFVPSSRAQVPDAMTQMGDELHLYFQCAVWAEFAEMPADERTRLFGLGHALAVQWAQPLVNGTYPEPLYDLASSLPATIAIGIGLDGPALEFQSAALVAGRVYQSIRVRTINQTLSTEDGQLPDYYDLRALAGRHYQENACAEMGRNQ